MLPHELYLPTRPLHEQRTNKARWNLSRSAEAADFYTLGYAGRDTGEFVALLLSAGVATLADIRHVPLSRYKPQFSKQNLRRHLAAAGVEYLHLPHLGVPRDIRGKAVGKQDRADIWQWYDIHVLRHFLGRNLHAFFNVAEHPVAFMCVEFDPTSCHRHLLFRALERNGLRGFDL